MFSLFLLRNPLAILLLIPMAALLSFVHFWFYIEKEVVLNLAVWQKSFVLPVQTGFYLYFGLLSLNAVAISRIFNRLNLIDYFSQIVGLLYLILSFGLVSLSESHLLISDFFLLIGTTYLFQIKNNFDAKSSVFSAASFLALAILFNPNHILLIMLPLIALARSKSFVLREYIIFLLAYANVALYLGFYFFYYKLKFKLPWTQASNFETPDFDVLGIYGAILLLLISAVYTRNKIQGAAGIRINRIVKLLFIGILIQVFSLAIIWLLKLDFYLSTAPLLALYLGYVYHFPKTKFLYHFLAYCILILAVLVQMNLF